MPRRKLGQVLVEAGLIDDFQLRSALSDQKRWGRPLGMTLVKLGFVNEDELMRILSRELDIPLVDLRGKRIAPDVLSLIPIDIAEKARCMPLFTKREGGADVLYLGMEDPTDLGVIDDLSFRTGLKARPVLVGPSQLEESIERYYRKLEWEAEAEASAGFETEFQAGDTAPLVFRPAKPSAPRAAGPLGPETLEQPRAGAAQAPVREAEFELQVPAAPPSVDPAGLGAEFITDPAPATARGTEPEGRKPREVPTRTILRAVTQLLVEKGVITRAELLEHVRTLETSGEDEDD